LVDDEVSEQVKEIFQMYVSGTGIVEICRILTARQVPRPNDHKQKRPMSAPWDVSTTCQMLEDPVYIGRYEMQKVTTVSYKNHTVIKRPKEEWVVIENHHPAIVDIEVFDAAQRLCDGRRRRTKHGDKSILSGLIFCNDCGNTLMSNARYEYHNRSGKTLNRKDILTAKAVLFCIFKKTLC